jgi:hypothetical protein
MEIMIKKRKKGIVREVFESYRDLQIYKMALLDIYCMIDGVSKPKNHFYMSETKDSWMFDYIVCEIGKMKLKIQEFENSENNTDDRSNQSPNP